MNKKVLEKWLPLILLGAIGMFLSEFLIWNVSPLIKFIPVKIFLCQAISKKH